MKNKLKGKNGLKVKRVSRFKNKVESSLRVGSCRRQNLSGESVKTGEKKVRRKLLLFFLFSVKIKRFL